MVEFQLGVNTIESNSSLNKASNNAVIRQDINGISSQSSYLEAKLGEKIHWMWHRKSIFILTMITLLSTWVRQRRIFEEILGSFTHLFNVRRRERRRGRYMCVCCIFDNSSRCVDRRYPFLITHDPRYPLEIMEDFDSTHGIWSQYCFFNIENLKQHRVTHTNQWSNAKKD